MTWRSYSLVLASTAFLLRAPVIRHQAVEYMPNNRFPQLEATIESEKGIQSAKLYFRAAQHPDFYYVEMTEETLDTFRAVIPIPEKETEKVVYYIEATGNNPDTARTGWFEVKTTDQPVEAYFRGEDPGIVVGKVLETSTDMPPGFKTAGIVGFIGAAGTAIAAGTAGGGGAGAGIGAGTAVLAGVAAAAGAGGIAVLATESRSAATDTSSLRACFTTLPDPAIIEEDESITLDGRCSEPGDAITSYRWELGDGRTREGPFIRPIYRTAGSYNVTLTISDGTQNASSSKSIEVRAGPAVTTTTTSVPAQQLTACFRTTPDPPLIVEGESVTLDGRCSTPAESITTYRWDFGDGRTREGAYVQALYQTAGTFTVSLTVSDGTQSDQSSETLTVNPPTVGRADIGVTLGADPRYIPGLGPVSGDYTYTIRVQNNGPQTATDVSLESSLTLSDPNVARITAVTYPGCSTTSNLTMRCQFPEVASGAALNIAVDCFVQNTTCLPGGCAPGQWFRPSAAMTGSSSADPQASNDSDSMQVDIPGTVVVPGYDLSVGLSATPNDPGANQLTYDVYVDNLGPSDGDSVVLTINFPTQVTAITSAPPGCNALLPTTTCNLPNPMSPFTRWAGTIVTNAIPGIFTTTASATGVFPPGWPDPNPANNSVTISTSQALRQAGQDRIATWFTSYLEAPPPDGRARARVTVNQSRTAATDNSMPFRHAFVGRSGRNTVEGSLLSTLEGGGRWRFDFRGTDHLVVGSLRVTSGAVISMDAYSVVFRLDGIPGEQIRFVYQLSP